MHWQQLNGIYIIYFSQLSLPFVQCFRRIFSLPPSIKVIAVMGDNDVGGEGNDIMNDLVLRYVITIPCYSYLMYTTCKYMYLELPLFYSCKPDYCAADSCCISWPHVVILTDYICLSSMFSFHIII